MDILKIQPKKLSLNNYNLLQNIGAGSFGIIKLAIEKQTGKYYAIKIQKKSEIIKKKHKKIKKWKQKVKQKKKSKKTKGKY